MYILHVAMVRALRSIHYFRPQQELRNSKPFVDPLRAEASPDPIRLSCRLSFNQDKLIIIICSYQPMNL